MSKMQPLQDLLRDGAAPRSRSHATRRRSGERLPWGDAARLLIVLSMAGWVGIFALWRLAF